MIQSNNTESTQPNRPVAPSKPKRGRAFLLNAFILVALLALGIFGGYQSALSIRRNAESSTLMEQLGEQFQYALVDLEFGRYEIAKQRLEFIIGKDSTFPGAQEKLTEVLVQINLQENYVAPTMTALPMTLTPTPDFSGAEEAFAHAQQLIAAQDWSGALGALDALRKLDPAYNTSQVDGMYYFALRNNGYNLIVNQGNLEGGIYYMTLAERFGPLDNTANGLREGARVYLVGASFWEINWEQAIFYFTQARNWGSLWDGSMTANERFWFASMRYGDELVEKGQYCEENEAYFQYLNAQTVAPLDKLAQNNFDELLPICNPPSPTPDLSTPTPTATGAVPTIETTPVVDTPVPTTEVPPTETTPSGG
jgi:tetratricopeptide (TPR) repeat protein